MKKIYFLVMMVMMLSGISWGQVNMNTSGSHTQNFNSLASSGTSNAWTDNSTIANWYSQRTGSGTTYAADAGTGNAGNMYSYGTGANADRAIGSLGSGNANAGNFAWGVLLRNTSGYTITNITVAFTGEQWRNSAAAAQTINFYYKSSASTITSLNPNSNGTWTAVSALNFTSPITGGTAGALDGNAGANRTVVSATSIPSLSLANNDYIMLKWDDPDHTGIDHGLSIDDVTITWKVPIVSTTSGNWSNTATWVGGVVPTSTDNVIISDGHTVTADVAVTRDAGTTLTVNATAVLATNLTYTNNGTTTVNGSFQINEGGWAMGTGFVYGAAGTLVFNNSTGPYGVGNDAYWPSSSGPVNVTVQNTGGITMNVARTVTGLCQTSDEIANANNLTFNGTFQINAGGYISGAGRPFYGPASLLKYNTGGTYGRGNEWYCSAGTGCPNDLQISNNTALNVPNGAIFGNGQIQGNLTIDAGSAMYMDYGAPGQNQVVEVYKNVVLNGSLSLGDAIGGDLHVKGNWTNAGTLQNNGRAVIFNGTSGDQTITGVTAFDYFTVNKAADNVVLANNISCNNGLTLTSGKIVLGANDLTLLNNAPSALSASSSSSYVVTNGTGAFKRAIGTAFGGQNYHFPVGTLTNVQLATVTFGSISANNTLAARFITGASGNAGLPLTEGENIARTANDGYWEINAASATADLYTGSFVANGFTDITDYSKVHLLKRVNSASNWAFDGTHTATTGSNALATLQRTGMSGFSQFAVGGESLISLPVVMLSFSGYKQGSVNKLSWTTLSEQNNRGFAVERSADGVNYSAIGFVNTQAVNGNSDASLTYSFTDANPSGSKQYYRLRQQDINGVSRLSNVIVIKGEKVNTLTIDGLYPNPVSSQLNVAVSSPVRGTVTLQVVDMTGRILSQQVKAIAEGSNTVSVNVAGLSNGSYILKVVNAETGAVSAKFSKQ